MGRPGVHQIKSTKQGKAKKKPIRVVYISNPMRVTTSAAEFRGLVQKLTGRDSNVADMAAADSPVAAFDIDADELSADYAPGSGPAVRPDPSSDLSAAVAAAAAPFEVFDEVCTPQMMLESLPGLAQSTLCYESLSRWILEMK